MQGEVLGMCYRCKQPVVASEGHKSVFVRGNWWEQHNNCSVPQVAPFGYVKGGGAADHAGRK